MANDLNSCSFIGRLGEDPKPRYLPNGDEVSGFSIACGWKTSKAEGVEWVRVTAFGKLAEICNKYLTKGKQCFIQGRMQTRSWEQDGVTKYMTEVVADRMQMLGDAGGGERQERPQQQRQDRPPQRQQSQRPDPPEWDGSDVPF